ncbi:MAG: glycosyltransferase family 4 protein [Verrucomicrobiia bacterium]
MLALLTFALATIAVAIFAVPVRWFLRRAGVIDRPNERSSHSHPTVRGGGVAIMAILLGASILVGHYTGDKRVWVLAGACLVLAIVSFADDLASVSRWIRFGSHALCAFAALAALGWPQVHFGFEAQHGWAFPPAVGWLILLLWIVGYTNAFNFMDGINGIAAGQALLTAGATAMIALWAGAAATDAPVLVCCIVAGSAAGFLPHNFPKAAMFMGDVGSAPLGFLLATLAVWVAAEYGWWLLIPLLLLHANYIFDTGITLLRRVFRGEHWYEPHREHFYQRLVRSGKTHAFATGTEIGLQLVTGAFLWVYLISGWPMRILLISAVLSVWAIFFGWCESRFVRSLSDRPMSRETDCSVSNDNLE